MAITLHNPKTGADIGVTDANGVGQLILSDGKAYVHKVGETITYENNIGKEMKNLYPFLVNIEEHKEIEYEKVELEGKEYYIDPTTKKVYPKEEIDSKVVKDAIERQALEKKATPSLPKEAVKVRVDRVAIARQNTKNVLQSFQDYAKSDFQFEGEGLTAD